MKDRETVGASAFDYLMYSGFVTLGFLWAQAAKISLDALADGTSEEDFYVAKLETAKFYFKRLLPRTRTHAECMQADVESLMGMTAEQFML